MLCLYYVPQPLGVILPLTLALTSTSLEEEGANSGWKFCSPSVRITDELCDSAVPEFGKFKRVFSTSFYWGFVSIIG